MEAKLSSSPAGSKIFALPQANKLRWAKQKPILESIAAKSLKSMFTFVDALTTLYGLSRDYLPPEIAKPTEPLRVGKFLTALPLDKQAEYLDTIFPFIATQALKLESLFPLGTIPFLVRQTEGVVRFSREQVACLVAACFFCLTQYVGQGHNMKDANFSGFYTSPANRVTSLAI